MIAIPLGLVTVPSAGTPTKISAAMVTAAGGPANCKVAGVEFCADPAMSGTTSYVKNAAGVIIAPLLKPANGYAGEYKHSAPAGGNTILATSFAVDVATNSDGVYVTLWVD